MALQHWVQLYNGIKRTAKGTLYEPLTSGLHLRMIAVIYIIDMSIVYIYQPCSQRLVVYLKQNDLIADFVYDYY